MIKFVVFDLDDTLYPELEFVKSGFRAVAPVLSRWLEISRQEAYRILWEEFNNCRKHVFDLVLRRYNCWSSEKVSFLLAVYRSHLPRIGLYPDARSILSWLREKGYRVGILTDGYFFVQRQKIRALRLEYHVDEIIFTDLLGREFWKPHPRPFELVLDKAGCPADQAVYVGDNPLKDFLGAKKVGMRTIQIKRNDGIYSREKAPPGSEADLVIPSLLEIKSLLDRDF